VKSHLRNTMDDEIQLVSDDDGLAVIGDPVLVEEFLRSEGLWASSKKLDLRRLKSLFGIGADVVQAASEIAASSARWLKLTPESAHLYKKYGLMGTKTPGVSHAMVGKPGSIQKWLQVEQGPGSLLTNPALLSGAAGIMAQVAMQQSMADITSYLATIDEKVDDVLRKQDDVVVAQMVGTGHAIDRALTIREETGGVTETLWSTVDQAHTTIGATQTYALDQLDAIARKLESTRIGGLAKTAGQAESEVPKWLAVLAYCLQKQDAIDVLELDRVLDESPEKLAAYRRGLARDRQKRRELISGHTEHLLARMGAAAGMANAQRLLHLSSSEAVIHSGNHVAAGVHDFHGRLGIESSLQSWEAGRLGDAAEMAANAIQKTKEATPSIAAVGVAAAVVIGKALHERGTTRKV
jgi:hypothetical protein